MGHVLPRTRVKLMRDLSQLQLLLSTDLALVQAAQQCEPDASLVVVSCCEASQRMRVPESQEKKPADVLWVSP